jgi:hypothetical protein
MLVRDNRADAFSLQPKPQQVRFPWLRETRNRHQHGNILKFYSMTGGPNGTLAPMNKLFLIANQTR